MIIKALQQVCLAVLLVAGTATICAGLYALAKGLVTEPFQPLQTCKEK